MSSGAAGFSTVWRPHRVVETGSLSAVELPIPPFVHSQNPEVAIPPGVHLERIPTAWECSLVVETTLKPPSGDIDGERASRSRGCDEMEAVTRRHFFHHGGANVRLPGFSRWRS